MTGKPIFLAAGILPLAYFLYCYRFSFNFEIEENGHYWLLLFFSFLQVCNIIFSTLRNRDLRQCILNCLAGLTILFTYLISGPGNEYACVCLALGIGLTFFYQLNIPQLTGLLYGFLPFLLVESIWAVIQYFLGQPIKGSLQNTGIFSIYLSVHIPLVYYAVCKKKQKRAGRYFTGTLFVFFLFFSLCIILKNQSRTALISSILVITLLLYENTPPPIREKTNKIFRRIWYAALPAALSLLAGLAWQLYTMKKLSAQGRLLMSNIAFNHITDHFWFGTGIGKFTWYYPQWQANYFQNTPAPPHDFYLSAGESYVIFNEYLQLFETVGIVGFILCVLALVAFFKTQSTEHKDLLRTIRLTVITILLCGFTAYPFHINIVFLLFVICFSVALKMNSPKMQPRFSRARQPLQAVSLAASVLLFVLALNQGYAVWKWQRLRGNNELTYAEKKTAYALLYPTLKNDGKFLTDYGALLEYNAADAPQAVSILEEARQRFFSRQTIETLGYAYWKTNDLPKAVSCFEWENNYLPNLFGPKLTLMKLYKEMGNTGKMNAIGHNIINTTPKIPSEEVNAIKFQAKALLNR